jgi:hypothetical protein
MLIQSAKHERESHCAHVFSAFGELGLREDIEVRLGRQLTNYTLPPPPLGRAQIDAVRSSLRILDLVPDRIGVPVLGLVYRAALGEVRSAVHLFGRTGAGKTAIAALAQQHMGASMDATHLPGSWESTDNALETLLRI